MSGEAFTVAVNWLPNRVDQVISLHVGDNFVILSGTEARLLAAQIMDLCPEPKPLERA